MSSDKCIHECCHHCNQNLGTFRYSRKSPNDPFPSPQATFVLHGSQTVLRHLGLCSELLGLPGHFNFLRGAQRHCKNQIMKLFGPNYSIHRTVRYFFWLRRHEKITEALKVTFHVVACITISFLYISEKYFNVTQFIYRKLL